MDVTIDAPANFGEAFSRFEIWKTEGDEADALSWTNVDTIKADERRYLIHGLKPNTNYTFAVDAKRHSEGADISIVRKLRTPPEGVEYKLILSRLCTT